jgi:enamine deaminase RidA (YjgF/YER057c/UK114 family)
MNEKELRGGLAPTPGYRYASIVGHQLFVAGQVPLDADGELVGRDDPTGQARACLENLHTLVALHGFALEHIRHLTISVVGEHQNLLDAWDAVTEWFEADVPPATLVGVNLLGYGDQLVEIDATIVKDEPDDGSTRPFNRS